MADEELHGERRDEESGGRFPRTSEDERVEQERTDRPPTRGY
jgi:hypothetical protein